MLTRRTKAAYEFVAKMEQCTDPNDYVQLYLDYRLQLPRDLLRILYSDKPTFRMFLELCADEGRVLPLPSEDDMDMGSAIFTRAVLMARRDGAAAGVDYLLSRWDGLHETLRVLFLRRCLPLYCSKDFRTLLRQQLVLSGDHLCCIPSRLPFSRCWSLCWGPLVFVGLALLLALFAR